MTRHTQPADRLAARIMWGMVLGLLAGVACRLAFWLQPELKAGAQWTAEQVLDPFGQIFLRTLFFIVVPLVFASLTLGVVQLGRLDKLGPLAGKTFFIFGLNMAVGVALGLLIMNTVRPGHRLDEQTRQELVERYAGEAEQAVQAAEERPRLTFRNLVEMFMPRNLLQAVVDFQILPLIVFALLVGAAGTQLDDQRQGVVREALAIMVDLSTRIVRFAMLLAPFAVAAMMTSLVVKMGLDILGALGLFVLCVLGGIAIHLFGTMTIWIKLFGQRSPAAFFKAIRTVLVTAFSTSSSSATLPTTIAVARQNLGVSASTAGFVLPLGATMNMSGTALYEGCVILFIAQTFGTGLSLLNQATLLVLTVLSAVAVAGIPGASIPVMIGLLASFQIPPDGILLILGIDRILDMARTVLNVGADLVAACIVDRWTADDEGLVAEPTSS